MTQEVPGGRGGPQLAPHGHHGTAGTSPAVPTQTTYVESGPASDHQAAAEASATVERWREQKELYLSRFSADKIQELRGSLDDPPQGSPILE